MERNILNRKGASKTRVKVSFHDETNRQRSEIALLSLYNCNCIHHPCSASAPPAGAQHPAAGYAHAAHLPLTYGTCSTDNVFRHHVQVDQRIVSRDAADRAQFFETTSQQVLSENRHRAANKSSARRRERRRSRFASRAAIQSTPSLYLQSPHHDRTAGAAAFAATGAETSQLRRERDCCPVSSTAVHRVGLGLCATRSEGH